MNYIPLRVKTNYSLLTSLIDIEKLILKCKSMNLNAVAICDDNMYGVMEFYKCALKNDIKPIIGLDVTIEEKSILLYAKNYNGYQNLCYISSNDKTYDMSGRPYNANDTKSKTLVIIKGKGKVVK